MVFLAAFDLKLPANARRVEYRPCRRAERIRVGDRNFFVRKIDVATLSVTTFHGVPHQFRDESDGPMSGQALPPSTLNLTPEFGLLMMNLGGYSLRLMH